MSFTKWYTKLYIKWCFEEGLNGLHRFSWAEAVSICWSPTWNPAQGWFFCCSVKILHCGTRNKTCKWCRGDDHCKPTRIYSNPSPFLPGEFSTGKHRPENSSATWNVSVSDLFSEGSAIADTSPQTRLKVAASEGKAIYKATQVRGVSSQMCTDSLSLWCKQCELGRSKHRLLLWIPTEAPNQVV